jgi:hypothetical protein
MAEEENRKRGFLAFWTTLPGILTGLAALLQIGPVIPAQ